MEATRAYYADRGNAWIAGPAPAFARIVARVLGEEAEAGRAFLHESSLPLLLGALDSVLIAPHLDALFTMAGSGVGEWMGRGGKDGSAMSIGGVIGAP